MVITCPSCQARYRIDPSGAKRQVAKVKCPECQHLFVINLAPVVSTEVQQPQADSVTRPLVLIVDDANFFREMIKDMLKDLPVDVATAADGLEAWELIGERSPQLILLDLNIPGKGGKEILQDMRQQKQFATTRVVIMSGVERGDETAAEMRRLGADDFLNKSFKPRELQNRVRDLLGL